MGFIYSVLSLIIGAGVFLVGIVLFSESLKRNASRGKSALIKKTSDNRFVGFGIGFAITAFVQSSAATTVTAVGLVNSGILTLTQAASIMLGSHAGTTSTLFLVSLSSFDIRYIFMALGFAGALIKIVTKNKKWVNIADIFISFSILFVGLNLMSGALKDNLQLREFFINLFLSINNPALLVLLGLVFTVVLQSSTASTSLFLMMLVEGLLGIHSAMFLGLGAVAGSSSTALLASVSVKTKGKRAAFLNFLFSIIGTLVLTCILWIFGPLIVPVYERAVPLVWQFPVFQLVQNLLAAFMLIWFIGPLSRLTFRVFKEKEKPAKQKVVHTSYIDDTLLETPSIAVDLAGKETRGMMEKARSNLELGFDALISQDMTHKKKIKKEEEIIDCLSRDITKYIGKLTERSISEKENTLLTSYCRVVLDIERVGDYARKMLKDAGRMKKSKSKFSKKDIKHLEEMFSRVLQLFDLSMEIFEDSDVKKLGRIYTLDGEIDSIKSRLAFGHSMWLKAGKYFQTGGEYF
jgi:phosphate:Na+ symporter